MNWKVNFDYFQEFETKKEWSYCSIFSYFNKKNQLIALLLGYLHEFERRKAWLHCSIYDYFFTKLTSETNELIGRFLATFANLRPERNEHDALFFFFLLLSPIWDKKGIKLFFEFKQLFRIWGKKGMHLFVDVWLF